MSTRPNLSIAAPTMRPAVSGSATSPAMVSASRRSGSFEVCLPRKARSPPSGPGCEIYEIKHDGFRILARKDGNRARLITRSPKTCT